MVCSFIRQASDHITSSVDKLVTITTASVETSDHNIITSMSLSPKWIIVIIVISTPNLYHLWHFCHILVSAEGPFHFSLLSALCIILSASLYLTLYKSGRFWKVPMPLYFAYFPSGLVQLFVSKNLCWIASLYCVY